MVCWQAVSLPRLLWYVCRFGIVYWRTSADTQCLVRSRNV